MKKFSKRGYVYILTNPLFPADLLKIGMTTRTPEQRATEIYENHTGVPDKFIVAYKKLVANCEFAEEVVHNRLDNFRANDDREFFQIPLDTAKNIIEEACHEIEEIYGKPVLEDNSWKGKFCPICRGKAAACPICNGEGEEFPNSSSPVNREIDKSVLCPICNGKATACPVCDGNGRFMPNQNR